MERASGRTLTLALALALTLALARALTLTLTLILTSVTTPTMRRQCRSGGISEWIVHPVSREGCHWHSQIVWIQNYSLI